MRQVRGIQHVWRQQGTDCGGRQPRHARPRPEPRARAKVPAQPPVHGSQEGRPHRGVQHAERRLLDNARLHGGPPRQDRAQVRVAVALDRPQHPPMHPGKGLRVAGQPLRDRRQGQRPPLPLHHAEPGPRPVVRQRQHLHHAHKPERLVVRHRRCR